MPKKRLNLRKLCPQCRENEIVVIQTITINYHFGMFDSIPKEHNRYCCLECAEKSWEIDCGNETRTPDKRAITTKYI